MRNIAAAALLAGATMAPLWSQAPPAPAVKVIPLPDFWGANAIWGATGADSRGRIWLGIASNDDKSGSAHLYRFDPTTDVVTDMGDVVGALRKAGVYRDGEKQMKIHSRVVQMPDGYLYFASMDETGENPDGSKFPDWGGHLWRIGPNGRWEHLAVTKEALIAVAAGGRFVYALGYFEHVVYQYDTRSGRVNAKTIGSAGGHVSRNFFADERGHVFVPRVVRDGPKSIAASLVELDARLNEVGSTPLHEYFERGLEGSHGIVAVHPDGAGGWLFTTGKGRLYQVQSSQGGPSTVSDKGWLHPAGPRYVASMFGGIDGKFYGAAYSSNYGGRQFEWVTRTVDAPGSVTPLLYGDQPFPHSALLYGSITRDAAGRFYLVGTMKYKPVLLQVSTPTTERR